MGTLRPSKAEGLGHQGEVAPANDSDDTDYFSRGLCSQGAQGSPNSAISQKVRQGPGVKLGANCCQTPNLHLLLSLTKNKQNIFFHILPH